MVVVVVVSVSVPGWRERDMVGGPSSSAPEDVEDMRRWKPRRIEMFSSLLPKSDLFAKEPPRSLQA